MVDRPNDYNKLAIADVSLSGYRVPLAP